MVESDEYLHIRQNNRETNREGNRYPNYTLCVPRASPATYAADHVRDSNPNLDKSVNAHVVIVVAKYSFLLKVLVIWDVRSESNHRNDAYDADNQLDYKSSDLLSLNNFPPANSRKSSSNVIGCVQSDSGEGYCEEGQSMISDLTE